MKNNPKDATIQLADGRRWGRPRATIGVVLQVVTSTSRRSTKPFLYFSITLLGSPEHRSARQAIPLATTQ